MRVNTDPRGQYSDSSYEAVSVETSSWRMTRRPNHSVVTGARLDLAELGEGKIIVHWGKLTKDSFLSGCFHRKCFRHHRIFYPNMSIIVQLDI
jgi:hypothetical protein